MLHSFISHVNSSTPAVQRFFFVQGRACADRPLHDPAMSAREEFAAAAASNALLWAAILEANFQINGDASSFITFFSKIAKLSRTNGALAIFLLTSGHVVPSGTRASSSTGSRHVHPRRAAAVAAAAAAVGTASLTLCSGCGRTGIILYTIPPCPPAKNLPPLRPPTPCCGLPSLGVTLSDCVWGGRLWAPFCVVCVAVAAVRVPLF